MLLIMLQVILDVSFKFSKDCGGERGIRTLEAGLIPLASLAGKCLRPLGQLTTYKQYIALFL